MLRSYPPHLTCVVDQQEERLPRVLDEIFCERGDGCQAADVADLLPRIGCQCEDRASFPDQNAESKGKLG